MSYYINNITLQAFAFGDDYVKLEVLNYIMELLNCMTSDVAKNWLRADGYFRWLYFFVSSSLKHDQIWNAVKDKNLISTLIDFVMEKNSPVRINPKNYSLGTKTHPMDFFWGISTIRFLLKYSFGLTGKNYEIPTISDSLLYHLSDNDVICLSHIGFYQKMLQERQNLPELSLIIQRLCILNIDFSRAIIPVVLETINSITDSKDEMVDLSIVCENILKIRDDFWLHRAQMLLGVGSPYVSNNNMMSTFDDERYSYNSIIMDLFPV